MTALGQSAAARTSPLLLRHDAPYGPNTAPRALLLHGMANNAAIWDSLRAAMPELVCSVADLPWRGGGVPDWSHERDPGHWVREALDRTVHDTGRVDVVIAHSYSATLLLDQLTREEGTAEHYGLRGVVFVAPFYRASPGEFDWDTVAGLVDKILLTMEEGIRVVAGGRGNADLHGSMARRVCERIGPYGWTRFFDQYLSTPWIPTSRIHVPALVLSGTRDTVTPTTESAALARGLPLGRYAPVPGCGHFPMVEATGTFTGELAAFVHQFIRIRMESAR
ncbi:alpha/beta fold hydrolase [Streptomyces gobiensis]|uniref:alpha/beta fold hydrolase n=1 Tax=Streptomyces gobiensis TaxID=2875706 RepID=UPI001E34FC6E|nr:alpha/beta hydrolase [Streptomyces gobiensis]UGY94195.1 alpha/beta hydrolase [Streptomyces gobiensis]